MKASLPSFLMSWTPHFEGDKAVLSCHQPSAGSVLQSLTEILDLDVVSERLR